MERIQQSLLGDLKQDMLAESKYSELSLKNLMLKVLSFLIFFVLGPYYYFKAGVGS